MKITDCHANDEGGLIYVFFGDRIMVTLIGSAGDAVLTYSASSVTFDQLKKYPTSQLSLQDEDRAKRALADANEALVKEVGIIV